MGKSGVKSVYESGKLILSRNGVFVGNSYSSDGMVKLCIVDNAINNKNVVSAYILDFVSLWHGILAHIGISTMKRLVKCDMINCNVDEFMKFTLNLK